ncbi:MAG: hypothetical protein WD971_04515 [Pirellulales bacterium]
MARRILDYESRGEPLLSRREFVGRLAASCLAAAALIAVSLYGGMCGYRYFEGMPWVDAFVNAAMILSGMGPVSTLETSGGKIFAGSYALYSGLALILATGLIIAPVVHRVMHRFHLEAERDEE